LSFSPDETASIGNEGQQLEDVFVGVAARTGVRIADPYVLAEGHGPCASASDRWVEGAVPRSPGIAFHPNQNGHVEMAQLVVAELQGA
jgi:hypothetical protein